VTVYLAWRKSREEERARVRSVLAEAFEVVTDYTPSLLSSLLIGSRLTWYRLARLAMICPDS
jgi:hypothetical protein